MYWNIIYQLFKSNLNPLYQIYCLEIVLGKSIMLIKSKYCFKIAKLVAFLQKLTTY